MGTNISAALLQTTNVPGWQQKGRGPKLRQLFGAYRSQDIWAVQRKFKSLDDGHGYLSFEEIHELLYFDEPGLLFVWDLFSHQNELMNIKELLTIACIFSGALLEEKARFLAAVFDTAGRGLSTGAEIADMCTVVLKCLGKCTGSMTKAKEVTPQLMAELPHLVPICADVWNQVGEKEAFHNERVIGQLEIDRCLVPSIRDAYETLPLNGFIQSAAKPPPPGWATASTNEGPAAAAEDDTPIAPSSKNKHGIQGPKDSMEPGADPSLSHLAWQTRLEDKENDPSNVDKAVQDPASVVHRWLVLGDTDWPRIAKDVQGFRKTFCKSVCYALGLPVSGGCVNVLNVTSGGNDNIVLELQLRRPPETRSESRDAQDMAQLLETQISSSHSALRHGALAPFLAQAMLLGAAPKAMRETESLAPTPKGPRGMPVRSTAVACQTDTFELGTPRAGVVKGASASGACTKRDEDVAVAALREAVRQLQVARDRQVKAKAGEKKAKEEVRKREESIDELRLELERLG